MSSNKTIKSIFIIFIKMFFESFTILGDGRTTLIGEYKKPNGELVDFHLKGCWFNKVFNRR